MEEYCSRMEGEGAGSPKSRPLVERSRFQAGRPILFQGGLCQWSIEESPSQVLCGAWFFPPQALGVLFRNHDFMAPCSCVFSHSLARLGPPWAEQL
jgi:hypothetical protein